MKKIVVIGPECTGKSTLAKELADYYNTQWVPEYARDYIDNLQRPYSRNDLLTIAKGQLQWEDDFVKKAHNLLICDTDLRVIKIWEEHKYGNCNPEILSLIESRNYDLYIFTDIDIPWESDPQREHESLRSFFYDLYEKELQNQQTPVIKVSGSVDQRKKESITHIDRLLKSSTRKG